jgi:hypothetical protein
MKISYWYSTNERTYNLEYSIFMPDCWENLITNWFSISAFELVLLVVCDEGRFIFYSIQNDFSIWSKFWVIHTKIWASVALVNRIWSAMMSMLNDNHCKINEKIKTWYLPINSLCTSKCTLKTTNRTICTLIH